MKATEVLANAMKVRARKFNLDSIDNTFIHQQVNEIELDDSSDEYKRAIRKAYEHVMSSKRVCARFINQANKEL